MAVEEPHPLVPPYIGDKSICMVVKIGQAVLRTMELGLQPLGLRVRHHNVLKAILEEGPRSQQELGDYLRIDRATMVATVDDLERLGYVERKRDEHDRRRYAVEATEAAEQAVAAADETLAQLDDELLADLTPTQRESLYRLVSKLSSGRTLPQAFDDARRGAAVEPA